ncbi:helix-turn-helix domain-containing protein [Carboxylicivirga taeanensis]|uniref:helix-turn-helix domain-containing protein n=1 Tax=Carboxylicivirga taeanensis TaxID=1416875 RepID=UPI003F6DF273
MADDKFLNKVKAVILQHLTDEDFNVNELAAAMGLSRSQLFRKLKEETHHSATVIIRDIRLEEALKLIEQEQYTIAEIAFQVGFNSPSYFNKCFHEKYGYAPGEYQKLRHMEANRQREQGKKGVRIKNIIYPLAAVGLLLIIILLLGEKRHTVALSQPAEEPSIAVLPFLDLSPQQNREYVALGLTDAIILELSKVRHLRVVSRGSAEFAQDSIKHYPLIAKKLGVNLLLEGSVVYVNDSLRVNAQLIDPVPDEKHLWAQKYEQDAKDIFRITNSISRSVANEIQLAVTPPGTQSAALETSVSYEPYLKARHLWQQQTPQSLQGAIELLKHTIEEDSTFAPAFSLLAECYISVNKFIRNNEKKLQNRQEGRLAIDRALERAIALDGSLAEAFITKGNILGKFDYNWQGMKEMVEKGLELNPNNALGYSSLSQYYSVKGDMPKALAMAREAEKRDPLNPRTCSLVAKCYTFSGLYEQAIRQYSYVLEMFPSYGFAWDGIGYAYYMQGDKAKALAAWTELHRFIGNHDLVEYYQRESFDRSIDYWLKQTTTGEKMYCSNPAIIAMVHLFVDDKDGAMDYLEFAYKYKDPDLPFIILLPSFNKLTDTPRFMAIAEQVGVQIPR